MKKNIASVLLLGTVSCFSILAAAGSPQTLRWLFAHGPDDLRVYDLTQVYSKRLSAKIDGPIQVQLRQLPDSTWNNYKSWTGHWKPALDQLMSGEVDIAQIPAHVLKEVDPMLGMFDLPFLFQDQQHVEAVLNGDLGKQLLQHISQASGGKLRAFAFAYSGGFRQIISNRPIRSADDFKKLKIAPIEQSEDCIEVLRTLGSQDAATKASDPFASFQRGETNVYVTPYKDFLLEKELVYKKVDHFYLNEVNFNLFTTVILMSESRFQKFSAEQQAALTEEIASFAKDERMLFVNEAMDSRAALAAAGMRFMSLAPAEREKIRARAARLYAKFNTMPGGAQLIAGIGKTEQELSLRSVSSLKK